jgi:uncharacterized protein
VIVEGVITSRNEAGEVNISPMGPTVDRTLETFVLRPFPSSRTARNLDRLRYGVFHITDDVELLVRAAIGKWESHPACRAHENLPVDILEDACRWYAFHVEQLDRREPRWRLECRVVEKGWHRDFLGFNRAKHAVVEGAILATRVAILPREEIQQEMARLEIPVAKTAGPAEQRAFALLQDYLRDQWERGDQP